MRVSRIVGVAALGALPMLPACDHPPTGAAEGGPTLSILLKDAPGEVRAAVVTLAGIYLQPEDGPGADGRVWLSREEVTTDLLTLANDVAVLVDEAPVPPGTYRQLRFVITGGYIEVEGAGGGTEIYASSPDYAGLPEGVEATGRLKMPSFAQSGLKVNLPGGAIHLDDESQVLLVDFDVAQSFGKPAGKSGPWVMHPSIRASDFEVTGGLRVAVRLGDGVAIPAAGDTARTLADFAARLVDAEVEEGDGVAVALEDGDGDGVYEAVFRYRVPGAYDLSLAAPTGVAIETAPALPLTVDVAEGATASVEVTVSAAAVAAGS